MVGDAIGIESEGSCQMRVCPLVFVRTECLSCFACLDDIDQAISEEVDRFDVNFSAVISRVVQHTVLLHVEGVFPMVAVFGDQDDLPTFIEESFPDFLERYRIHRGAVRNRT